MKHAWWGWMTAATALAAFALIVVGAVVRVADAGLGCGDDWPTCNGATVPAFQQLATAIEYSHRVLAGVILLLTAGLVAISLRWRPGGARATRLALLALALVITQALLGAATVFVELDARMVTAHLGMAEAYFAVIVALALSARAPALARQRTATLGVWPMVAAGAVYVLLLSGAYIAAGPGAAACTQWPTCGGRYVPTGASPVDAHLAHRWLALVALGAVAALVVRAWRTRAGAGEAAALTAGVAVLMVEQALVGAAVVWTHLDAAVRVIHLVNATLIWGLLVAIIVFERAAEPAESRVALEQAAHTDQRRRAASTVAASDLWRPPTVGTRALVVLAAQLAHARLAGQQQRQRDGDDDDQRLQAHGGLDAVGVGQRAGDRHADRAGHEAETQDQARRHAGPPAHQLLRQHQQQRRGRGGQQSDQRAGQEGDRPGELREEQHRRQRADQRADDQRAAADAGRPASRSRACRRRWPA